MPPDSIRTTAVVHLQTLGGKSGAMSLCSPLFFAELISNDILIYL